MKLVLIVAGVVATLFAGGGFAQFFAASTDAAGAFRANLALAYAALSIGFLVLFCAAHVILSRLDALLRDQVADRVPDRASDRAPDGAPDRAGSTAPAMAASNPYASLTRYYFTNTTPGR